MCGTSTDVAAVLGGRAQVTSESVVGGVPIRFPMVDIHTIGAGGGSIAWLDDGGALRVGPQSAGASPGPACYGRGGEEPTVTDANLVLGHLRDGAVLGGEITLDRSLAERALERLGMDAVEAARGVVRVVDANMARALRVVSVERGIDPRGLALVAFGGAGPLHACSLAEELGIERVLVPHASGVLCALGLAVADLRRDYIGWDAEVDLPGAAVTRLVDARYPGQSHELTIEEGADFHAAHEQRYGFRLDGEPEVVTRRVVAIVSRPRPELPASGGDAVTGPAVVELPGATCLVREGWSGKPDAHGTLELTWTR
jgi:N-methylhydantoinase A